LKRCARREREDSARTLVCLRGFLAGSSVSPLPSLSLPW
jgi:hypothetical protein